MLRRISRGRGNVCLAEAVAVSSALGLPVESVFVLDEPSDNDYARVSAVSPSSCGWVA
jgi:hypothetical protein